MDLVTRTPTLRAYEYIYSSEWVSCHNPSGPFSSPEGAAGRSPGWSEERAEPWVNRPPKPENPEGVAQPPVTRSYPINPSTKALVFFASAKISSKVPGFKHSIIMGPPLNPLAFKLATTFSKSTCPVPGVMLTLLPSK